MADSSQTALPAEEMQTAFDAVMKKYDRESNTRVWQGIPKTIVGCIMAEFSVYCLYMTLFSTVLPETRLSLFLGCIIIIGFLIYPADKHHVKPNRIPWYDIVLMVLGAGSFFYFAFNAYDIIMMNNRIDLPLIVMGVVGILVLFELCRRCVGIPILVVVAALLIYVVVWRSGYNSDPFKMFQYIISRLFYSVNGVIGTPINVCYTYIVLFISYI